MGRHRMAMVPLVVVILAAAACGGSTPASTGVQKAKPGPPGRKVSAACAPAGSVAAYFATPGPWTGTWNVAPANSCALDVSDASGKTIATLRESHPVTGVGEDFLTASDGWLLVNSGEGFGQYTSLYRTADGGATWTEVVSARSWYAGPGQRGTWLGVDLSFANGNDGWLMAAMGPGAGSEPKELLATTDGGASWQVVSSPPALPPAIDTDGNVLMDFTGPATGFIAASNPFSGSSPARPFIFRTGDGGRSWNAVGLPPLPSSHEAWQSATLDSLVLEAGGALQAAFTYSDPNTNDQATYCYSTSGGMAAWAVSACSP